LRSSPPPCSLVEPGKRIRRTLCARTHKAEHFYPAGAAASISGFRQGDAAAPPG